MAFCWCCPRELVPPEEDLLLSPIQRFIKYRVFPWKLVLHIAIALVSTILVFSRNSVHGVVSRELGQNFQSAFFPTDYSQFNGDDADNPTFTRYFIFSLADFTSGVDLLMDTYWSLPELATVSTAIAQAVGPGNSMSSSIPDRTNTIALPTVSWTHFDADTSDLFYPAASPTLTQTTEQFVMMGPNDTWPTTGRNESGLREILLRTLDIRYNLDFWAWSPASDDNPVVSRGCYVWRLEVTYDFVGRGQIEVLWSLNSLGRCHVPDDTNVGMLCIVTITTILAALQLLRGLVEGALTLGGFVRAYHIQETERSLAIIEGRDLSTPLLRTLPHSRNNVGARVSSATEFEMAAQRPRVGGYDNNVSEISPDRGPRERGDQTGASTAAAALPPLEETEQIEKHLHILDAMQLIRGWDVLAGLCEGVLLASCCAVLESASAGRGVDLAVPGWQLPTAAAAAGLWLSILRFLEHDPLFYASIITLEQALPEIGRFFVGCAPLFIALGLFDLVIFWQEPRYNTLNMVFVTLWSTLSGDAVRETFQHTEVPASVLRTLIANIQLVLLMLIFTYIVVNCSVAIVEEKFFGTFTAESHKVALARRSRQVLLRRTIQGLLSRTVTA